MLVVLEQTHRIEFGHIDADATPHAHAHARVMRLVTYVSRLFLDEEELSWDLDKEVDITDLNVLHDLL